MDLPDIEVGDWVCGVITHRNMGQDKEIVGIVKHFVSTGYPDLDFVHIQCPIYRETFVVRKSNIIRHKKSTPVE